MRQPASVAVRYQCRCMIAEVVVEVPYRGAGQDVVEWVEEVVGGAVTRDHAARSPLCTATATEYVKIPAPENAPYIGGRPVTN